MLFFVVTSVNASSGSTSATNTAASPAPIPPEEERVKSPPVPSLKDTLKVRSDMAALLSFTRKNILWKHYTWHTLQYVYKGRSVCRIRKGKETIFEVFSFLPPPFSIEMLGKD